MSSIPRLSALLLLVTAFTVSAHDPQLAADRQAMGQACAGDVAVAHCAGYAPGRGLGQCLRAFHRANPGYRFSPGCRTARHRLRLDRRVRRGPLPPPPPPRF